MPLIQKRTLVVEATGKHWVALITGRHPTYGLAREFRGAAYQADDKKEYLLDAAGIYEVCENGERSYLEMRAGEEPCWIDRKRAQERIIEIEEAGQGKLDDVIAKFNTEGGFSLN